MGKNQFRSPLRFAVAVAGTLLAAPAVSVAASAPQSVSMPAMSLDRAVTELAAQTGLNVGGDAGLLRGKTSPPLDGTYTPTEALNLLLRGSGVTFEVVGDNAVTLLRQNADGGGGGGPLALEPLIVEGWRTSEVEGFRSQEISSATKTNEAIADTPASVNVITRDVIEAQNARSVQDALRNVPGVTPGPNQGNISVQQEFSIRGFESSLVSVNGVERRSTGSLSLANVESVEVLKGPSSVLYGDLSPGGFVNVQTKRPQREFAAELSAGFDQVLIERGTTGNGAADVTGPVNEDRTLLYRFVVSAEGGSSFIDDVDSEQYLVAPSLSYIGLGGDLRIDFDFSYLLNDESFEYGVPAFNGRPDTRADYSTFFGSKFSTKKSEDYTAELRGDWQIADATSVDAALSWHRYDFDAAALRPGEDRVSPDNTIARDLFFVEQSTTDKQFEANVIQGASFAGADWRFLAGGDIRQSVVDRPNFFRQSGFSVTNVLNPDNDVPLPPTIQGNTFDETITAWGLYTQTEAWLFDDRLKLLGGFRYDDIEGESEFAGGTATRSDSKISPRAAALYKVMPTTSLYASYSTSFQQEVQFNPDEPPFEPTEGEQFEVGVKQEFFDGKALATFAAFQLTQKNLVQPGPTPDTSVQIGEARTRGIEVEISGEVFDGLNVIGGYAYLDTEVTEATDGTKGNRLRNTPVNSASLFVTYDIVDRSADRLTVGGGFFYQGNRFANVDNEVVLPNFVTVDLMAEYAFAAAGADLLARVGLKNVFDEEYFPNALGGGAAFRGQPRTLSAGLKMRF